MHTPFMMTKYLERPEANKDIFLDDGFMRTRDLGVYDKQGHFSYVERASDMIKYVYRMH